MAGKKIIVPRQKTPPDQNYPGAVGEIPVVYRQNIFSN